MVSIGAPPRAAICGSHVRQCGGSRFPGETCALLHGHIQVSGQVLGTVFRVLFRAGIRRLSAEKAAEAFQPGRPVAHRDATDVFPGD